MKVKEISDLRLVVRGRLAGLSSEVLEAHILEREIAISYQVLLNFGSNWLESLIYTILKERNLLSNPT